MSSRKPFRFAFLVADATQRTGEDWEALAAKAEALGYDTFGVTDHLAKPHAPLQVLEWLKWIAHKWLCCRLLAAGSTKEKGWPIGSL